MLIPALPPPDGSPLGRSKALSQAASVEENASCLWNWWFCDLGKASRIPQTLPSCWEAEDCPQIPLWIRDCFPTPSVGWTAQRDGGGPDVLQLPQPPGAAGSLVHTTATPLLQLSEEWAAGQESTIVFLMGTF